MCVCAQSLSLVQLFVTPWTVIHQAPLSMEFSRQEPWIGLPFPPPGDLPDPRIELMSPASPALLVDSLPLVPPGKPPVFGYIVFKMISLGVSENTSRNSKVKQKN